MKLTIVLCAVLLCAALCSHEAEAVPRLKKHGFRFAREHTGTVAEFVEALKAHKFKEALVLLNALPMFDALTALSDVPKADRDNLVNNHLNDVKEINTEKVKVAASVVDKGEVPQGTNLAADIMEAIWNFLRSKIMGDGEEDNGDTDPVAPGGDNNGGGGTSTPAPKFDYPGIAADHVLDISSLKVGDVCWPLVRSATKYPVNKGDKVPAGSWGSPRKSCEKKKVNGQMVEDCYGRCHTGYDIMDKVPGTILAMADGEILSITPYDSGKPVLGQRGWYKCIGDTGGWRYEGDRVINGKFDQKYPVAMVMVLHTVGSVKFVVNYGEINLDAVLVRGKRTVKKGEVLGTASYCGMLHFELYKDTVRDTIQWIAPNRMLNPSFAQCLTVLKPGIYDPRPLLSLANMADCPTV